MSKLADQFLAARSKTLASKVCNDNRPTYLHHKQPFEERGFKRKVTNSTPTANFHAANQVTNSRFQVKCIFCSLPHKSENCRKINYMDIKERKDLIKQSGACFVCLKRGSHVAKDCRSGKTCEKCSKNHHVVLCDERNHSSQSHEKKMTMLQSLLHVHLPLVWQLKAPRKFF